MPPPTQHTSAQHTSATQPSAAHSPRTRPVPTTPATSHPAPHTARTWDRQLRRFRTFPRSARVAACRLLYQMRHGGHQVLGWPSFSAYLRSRKIPVAWACARAAVYRRLAVELKLPERSWRDVPLWRLRAALPVLTAGNATQILEDARRMTPANYRRRLADRAGPGVARRDGGTILGGTYRLMPVDGPVGVRSETCLTVRGAVYAADDDGDSREAWFVDLPEMEMPGRPSLPAPGG